LTQLAGAKGCLAKDPAATACEQVRALHNIGQVAISPDGANLYAPARDMDAVVVFDRDPSSGALTQKAGTPGCVTSNPTVATNEGCANVGGSLAGASAVAVSPDGANVYVVGSAGSLVNLQRASNGSLSLGGSSSFCVCLLTAVAVSPDGATVYPGGPVNGGIVGVYARTAGTGIISFKTCYSRDNVAMFGGCTSAPTLGPVSELVVPDNGQLLITAGDLSNAASSDSRVLGWPRDPTPGATQGNLTTTSDAAKCVTGNAAVPNCQQRPGMTTPRGLALAGSSANHAYVAGADALVTIDRDPATKALTPRAGSCFSYTGSSFSGCSAIAPFADFFRGREAAATPNGQNVYFSTDASNPNVFVFDRSGGGELTRHAGGAGCLNPSGSAGCGTLRDGNRIESMVADPQSRNLYAAGNNRLFSFAIAPPTTDAPPAGPGTGTGAGAGADTTRPVASLSVPRQKLGKVAKSGKLVENVKTNEAGSFSGQAVLDAALAKRLRLPANGTVFTSAKPAIIAKGSRSAAAPGSYKLTLKLTAKARKKLARLRRVKLTLRTRVADLAGNRRLLKKTLTLRR
jgi:hypothetical protein